MELEPIKPRLSMAARPSTAARDSTAVLGAAVEQDSTAHPRSTAARHFTADRMAAAPRTLRWGLLTAGERRTAMADRMAAGTAGATAKPLGQRDRAL